MFHKIFVTLNYVYDDFLIYTDKEILYFSLSRRNSKVALNFLMKFYTLICIPYQTLKGSVLFLLQIGTRSFVNKREES